MGEKLRPMGRRTKPRGERTWSVSTRSHLPQTSVPVVALYDLRYSHWYPIEWADREYLTIGSDIAATIRVPDPTVSALHCVLTRSEQWVFLRESAVNAAGAEIRPRHGTFVNGVRLRGECVLHPGLAVTLGRTILVAASTKEKPPPCEVAAATRGEFARRSFSMFRSIMRAAKGIRVARKTLERWKDERS